MNSGDRELETKSNFKNDFCQLLKGGTTVKRVVTILCLAAFCMVFAGAALAQNITSGSMTGAVTDPDGKAVVGATVTITNAATNEALPSVKTGNSGEFAVVLPPGVYNIEITANGFKSVKISNAEVIFGRTYNLTQKLEVGDTKVSVSVDAGRLEVLETQNTSVQNTITGRAITNLPLASRNAVLMGILDPGAQTVGGSRNSTFEGLPKGAINITFDGINVQDNVLKSSDGFFAINAPIIDDVQEFGITTNANDPANSSEGAVHMSYVSKGGSNAFHGGVWEYNRNTAFDANYYYNNLAGLPRQVLQLNEFGYKIGGPILKDKLFFFTDLDYFIFPQSLTRTRNLLTGVPGSGTGSANGFFSYAPSAGANPATAFPGTMSCTNLSGGLTTATSICSSNELALAAGLSAPNTTANQANGTYYPSVINPVILPYLAAIQSSFSAPGVTTTIAPSPFQSSISFVSAGRQTRKYPDFRLDYNITKHMSIEGDYHYAWYNGYPDILNNEDPQFPVAPFNKSGGAQLSNRNLFVIAWRWSIGSNKSNELRWGLQAAPVNFGLGTPLSIYPGITTDNGPVPVYTFGITGVSNPFLSPGGLQGRNTPVAQIHETFSWTKGTHQITFGGDATALYFNDFATVAGSVGFGIDTGDPTTLNMFTPGNFPGISNTDLGNAAGLYASLVGRVDSWSDNVFWSPKTNGFLSGAPVVDKVRQNEFGVYGNDSWRVRSNLTFNFGLRWEYQGAPYDLYNQYFLPSINAVWGVSGPGNLFKPGVIGGAANMFYQNDKNLSWYNKYYKGLDPSVGFAYQPGFENHIWKTIFGSAGKTVFRAGYSIVESREGLDTTIFQIIDDNPGNAAGQSMTTSSISAPSPGIIFPGSITLGGSLCPSFQANCTLVTPTTFTVPTIQNVTNAQQPVATFDPNLKPPRVQSWTVGIQRELGPDMALEIHYAGNHGTGLWDVFSLNEVNIFENGFLGEFNNAETNLAICKANSVACKAAQAAAGISAANQKSTNFADWGLAGQIPLPVMTGAFTASTVTTGPGATGVGGTQSSSFFRNSTFVNDLNVQGAGSFAGTLSAYLNGFLPQMVTAGFPLNFFTANPLATGGAIVLTNGAQSTYNALVVDFRRRLSHGLQFDANYSFSKSLTDYNANSATNVNSFTTLRNTSYDKAFAPFDTRHAFKMQGIWDLPFGEGRKWSSSSRIVNRIIGGWSFNSVTRWQTGQPIRISDGVSGGGTFNTGDAGINLIGITEPQLQSMLTINKTEKAGAVWYVPTSLLDANLQKANTAVLQPCPTAGMLCTKLFVHGPQFFEADWTIAKTTKITEHVNFEMRMEALNALNNQNFYWASGPGSSPVAISTQSTRFGQMGSNATNGAYSDINTTQFPGGRVIQLVGRVNF
jgi:hypothetical protein